VSTSATKTIVEHNRLIDRTPLTTPRVAPERSSKPANKNSFRRFTGRPDGWLMPFRAQPAEVSQARGGITGFFNPTNPLFSLQRVAIACDCLAMKPSPQPDPLEHLLSQARPGIGMEILCREALQREASRAHQDNPAFTASPEGRPTHPLAKGNAIGRTQGAFHR
jgi:hypothetical protein